MTLTDTSTFFNDDHTFITCLEHSTHGFRRGLPGKQELQEMPHVAQFLRDTVVSGVCTEDRRSHSALGICYRNGWLQAELSDEDSPIYVFTTKLHRRYAEHLVSTDISPFPTHVFRTVKDLCFAAIKNFVPSVLRNSRGTSVDGEPLEATFQDELYRACYTLLNNQLYLCSEWSGGGGDGRVGFFVRGTPWAIEILSNGDDVDEHIARFELDGRYYPWIKSGQIQDYILLDFRRTKPRKKRDVKQLHHVVFSKEFTSYEIYDSNLSLVAGNIILLAPGN